MAVNLTALVQAENYIRTNFFKADGAIQRLKSFVVMNEALPRSGNAILHGPGGYGKTEMGYNFIKMATGCEPFVVNMNQATTSAEIFGGTDLEKFSRGEGIHYLLDNSFMNHEWVIFEEGLEPRPRVLSALKHIITSGIFAAPGVLATPIKTKGILIVTNIDTTEFKESLDTEAFLERFPIQYRVDWGHLDNYMRFQASLDVINKFDPNKLIDDRTRRMLAEHFSGRKQSPRMISRAVQALTATTQAHQLSRVDQNVLNEVSTIFGFATGDFSEKIENDRIEHEINQARSSYNSLFKTLRENVTHFNSLKDSLHDPRYVIKLASELQSTIELLDSLSDSVIEMRVNAKFGKRGDELASWVNGRIGEMQDELEGIKTASWRGMLNSLVKLVEEKGK